ARRAAWHAPLHSRHGPDRSLRAEPRRPGRQQLWPAVPAPRAVHSRHVSRIVDDRRRGQAQLAHRRAPPGLGAGRQPQATGRRVEWYDAVRNERLPWSAPPPTSGLGASWLPVPAQGCPDAPPARFTYQFLTTLPTNPARLRTWIYAHKNGGQSADDQAWTDI